MRSVLLRIGVEDRDTPQAGVVAVDHRDDVGRGVDVDPLLEHALAERPVAQQRRRHDAPAQRLGDEVRGDLAPGQRADREVEQRALAGGRLPDRKEVAVLDPAARVACEPRVPPPVGGQTRTTIALLDEPTSRPRTSSSPSRSRGRRSVGSGNGVGPANGVTSAAAEPGGSVDVVAVLARADVAGRVERVAAQRAGRPPGADDAEGALDERAGGVGGEPDAEQVRAVLVVIVDLDERFALASTSSSSSPGARASMRMRSASPSQPSVSVVARKASLSGSSSGFSSGLMGAGGSSTMPRRSSSTRSCPSRSASTATWAFSSATLTTRRPSRAWRKNERLPGSPTVPVREPVGEVEDEEAAWHGLDCYRSPSATSGGGSLRRR